jgi:hypothetical protein
MSGIGGSFRRNGDHHSAVVCLSGPLWDALTRQTMRNGRGEMISFFSGLSSPTPFCGARRV